MISRTVNKTGLGVNVKFSGDIQKSQVANMIDECQSGKCGCDCEAEVMKKIETINVTGNDGDVTIELQGPSLGVKEIEEAVSKCKI